MRTTSDVFSDARLASKPATWRRLAYVAIAALLMGLAVSITSGRGVWLAHADTPGGLASGGTAAPPDTPLKHFETLTLPGVLGDVQAVVYDGNAFLAGSTSTVNMTGFTVPAGARAQTTYVVADGQCGFAAPNGCRSTTPTGGSGDTLTFKGQTNPVPFENGPDAFKGMGSDHENVQDLNAGCPWGVPPSTVGSRTQSGDTCLWDTRNFDVSAFVTPGDTSATATVTAGVAADGGDCINHEAQILAVGPAGAFSTAGVSTHGKGLRNQGTGDIIVNDVPPGSQVIQALLYWNILDNSNPGGAMAVNGAAIKGTMFATDKAPCWPVSTSFAFRADVTSLVTGNGDYNLSGYPTGAVDGHSPWLPPGSPPPMMEGASLLIFYGAAPTPGKVTGGGYIDPNGNLVTMADMIIQTGSANAGVNTHANFGFVVQFDAGAAAPTGNLEYIDHAAGFDIKAISFDLLVIGAGPCGPNTHAAFTGQATLNGGPPGRFRVDVDDCGGPSSTPPDDFSISFMGVPPYAAAGPLDGGNIVIHKS